ncbi:MAG: hypothetical protein JW931_07350 [Methanomicrobiaceae archaeon]|nr:hypothetical protein [Methanomicrobiaceae archaeon]
MVDKKINSILIIFILLTIVGICGCITIKDVDYEQYLKDSSFYRPSLTPTPTASIPGEQGTEPSGEIIPNEDGKTLDQAMEELEIQNSEGLLEAENMTIYQVMGTRVGIEGNADSWILGARQEGESILYSYDYYSGWNKMSWPGPLTEEEVNLETIISPEDLYRKNSAIISEKYRNSGVSYSDLFLKDGVYTVAIRDGSNITELKFKADTGELI